LWIIFVLASRDTEQGPVSFQVLFVHNKGRTDVLLLEFALCFVVHCPKQDRHFLCLWYVSLVSAVKQEIVRLIVEVISRVLVFWRGVSVFPVLLKLFVFCPRFLKRG